MQALLGHWQLQLIVVGTVAYAMVLGGAIGVEREMRNRPAGFRTHMLVAGASALLVGLADPLAEDFVREGYRELVRIDPLRLIEATVAAVGFLGAGTIFRQAGKDGVTGITTAASMLMSAAIGIAAGLHLHVLALGAAVLTLTVLRGVAMVERRFTAGRHDTDP